MTATVLKPPSTLDFSTKRPSLFLAGSIEMDTAEDWQAYLSEKLADLALTILNPRRDDWDSSWEATIDNPIFREQVEWELEGLEQATWIVMYFSPPTRSPITLLELGLTASTGRLVVCCPDGFWRKGNVDVVCQRYNVPVVASLDALADWIRQSMSTHSE